MSMADRDGVIWYDGKLVPWRDATTHVLTHTLHYGMGVFEGVRAYETPQGPAIFRLQAHTDRLFDSAHIMGMKSRSAKTKSTKRPALRCVKTTSTALTSGRWCSTDPKPWACVPPALKST